VISSSGRVRITRGTQSLCVDMLAAPGVQFTQSSAWPPDAPTTGPQQSHGTFASTQPSPAAEFIALMRVNVACDDTPPVPDKTSGVWTVPVDNRTVTIAADGGVTVGPTDITPPTVSITSPASGAIVSGMITVTASAADNVAVAGVRFKVNGGNLGEEDTVPPYRMPADTTTVPDGTYTLTAVARDTTGNLTTSAPVAVTVSNP
jgi:Bacterial Ig domain